MCMYAFMFKTSTEMGLYGQEEHLFDERERDSLTKKIVTTFIILLSILMSLHLRLSLLYIHIHSSNIKVPNEGFCSDAWRKHSGFLKEPLSEPCFLHVKDVSVFERSFCQYKEPFVKHSKILYRSIGSK